MSNLHIDWDKLSNLPNSENISFEKFCFHIASCMVGGHGTVSYFYNTPGSEFYIELNKPWEYEGILYSVGDVIGWQAKYWRGIKDDANSPLDSQHRKELIEGFTKTNSYRPQIKLWIICTPGCFIQSAWDTLLEQLYAINSNCKIVSWHRDIFEDIYLTNSSKYNGVFQHYFGKHFIGVEQINAISLDTLECLKKKYDTDLHTPSEFEKDLYAIVDDKLAETKIRESITALKRFIERDKKRDLFNTNHWGYDSLSENFIDVYAQDYNKRIELLDNLLALTESSDTLIEAVDDIKRILTQYISERKDRISVLNKESRLIFDHSKGEHQNIGHYLRELSRRVQDLEWFICVKDNKDSIINRINLRIQNIFSVFAEAGYGKTHFACSLAEILIKKELPVLLLLGSKFRHCISCERYLCEVLQQPTDVTTEDLLDALDFLAYTKKCKLPIIIDGLNETAPNETRWKDELPPLIRKIKRRRNLILITTCREKADYIKVIYGQNDYKDIENNILLTGFSPENLGSIVRKYFHKYDIQPIRYNIPTDFSNPLLLKIFCEANRGLKGFSFDEYSLSSCMQKYSDNLLDTISSKDGRPNRIARHKLTEGLNKVALYIWGKNNRSLDYYTEFAACFEEQYVERFLEEGMCFMLDCDNGTDLIQFSYDMLAGYHIAQSIITQSKNVEEFIDYINSNIEQLFGERKHTLAEDIIKNLFFLVPKKYEKQWFNLMPIPEIVTSGIEHMDIIISSEQGRKAMCALLQGRVDRTLKINICNTLYKRVIEHNNLAYFSLFIGLFSELSVSEWDELWNSKFVHYDTLERAYSLLHDRYFREQFTITDNVMFAICMCGITDNEYRMKFHSILQKLVANNSNVSAKILADTIYLRDPLIFESVISAITGLGLRSNNKCILNKCISILERFLESYSSNHIVLLDNLDTLYSYGEHLFKSEYDRNILQKNKLEIWDSEYTEEYAHYGFYSYDFDKYHIRPLYQGAYNKKAIFDSASIYGMLYARIKSMGYNGDLYNELQDKEYQAAKYRSSSKISYSYKYGRYAIMEMYGWLLLNGHIEKEYQNTFRTTVVDIDPSAPTISPMRTYTNKCFLPSDINTLNQWLKNSDIDYMKAQHIVKLPKYDGEWVLLRGYFNQKMDDRYANVFLSGTSHIVPLDITPEMVETTENDSLDYYHAFVGEMGWRYLEAIDEYDERIEDDRPRLLVQYAFSSWSSDRYKYTNFYMLNQQITVNIGLKFNLDDMEYYLGEEKVSVHYVNETDHFFFLRKDIVDTILKKYNAKIKYHVFEQRIIDRDLPETVIKPEDRFAQNFADIFYLLQE